MNYYKLKEYIYLYVFYIFIAIAIAMIVLQIAGLNGNKTARKFICEYTTSVPGYCVEYFIKKLK